MIRKAILGGVVAAALATLVSDTVKNLNNCAEYLYRDGNVEAQIQKFVGGKCFYYYANDSKQELLIYEPQPKQQNIGTLTEIVLDNQTGQIEISRNVVNDLRKGPNPEDTSYGYIHKITISPNEERLLIRLFQEYVRELNLKQKIQI